MTVHTKEFKQEIAIFELGVSFDIISVPKSYTPVILTSGGFLAAGAHGKSRRDQLRDADRKSRIRGCALQNQACKTVLWKDDSTCTCTVKFLPNYHTGLGVFCSSAKHSHKR